MQFPLHIFLQIITTGGSKPYSGWVQVVEGGSMWWRDGRVAFEQQNFYFQVRMKEGLD